MVSINQLTLGFLILQIYVSAAPSDTDKEVTSPVETDSPKLDEKSAPNSPTELNEDNLTQNQRQKRYYASAFSSVNPYYPGYNRRDVSQDIGNYGVDDQLTQIHRHLLQIASVARQPPPPPPSPPVHFPFWLPVFYIPQSGCNCKPNRQPQPTPRPDQNTTGNPGVETRFPELEDERMNWGIVNNDNNYDYDLEEDFSRPISFDPITVNTPMKRPPPPVEHGTTQGNQIEPQGTTTARPRPLPSPPRKPSPPQNIPTTGGAAFGAPYPTNFAQAERPSTCDAAILSCCHQAQVSFSCFEQQGCPDPRGYSLRPNPCDPNTILKVVEKYQKYYGQRNG